MIDKKNAGSDLASIKHTNSMSLTQLIVSELFMCSTSFIYSFKYTTTECLENDKRAPNNNSRNTYKALKVLENDS